LLQRPDNFAFICQHYQPVEMEPPNTPAGEFRVGDILKGDKQRAQPG
jgi:hypothetical protein